MKRGLLYFSLLITLLIGSCNKRSKFEKTDDGVVVFLSQKNSSDPRLVKLQVVSDKIIHVTSSPADTLPSAQSLIVVEQKTLPVKWELKEVENTLLLSTSLVKAIVSLENGRVVFTDSSGTVILSETNGGRSFLPFKDTVEKSSLSILQAFDSPADEALYGLGQQHAGLMNYKGKDVELLQYNSTVAVPFLVSSKNYGILWDNYSITKFGDVRSYQPLSKLKLYGVDGKEGGLTATYNTKTNQRIMRSESAIAYESLPLNGFPDGYKLGDGLVTWEGAVASDEDGEHRFRLWSAGYTKIWINDSLLIDKWREAWNPGLGVFTYNFKKGQKYSFKIEWDPNGGESYLALKWIGPVPAQDENKFSFLSEAGDKADYYFVYGANMDEVISGYRQLTGKAQVMPKWAMGFWQSRERYKTQEEILSTVKEFRKRRIPIDNIVLDWSYWKEDQWGSQEFDTSRFPDAKGMIKELHEKYKVQLMISAWPKFYEGIENYRKFDENGWLYKQNIINKQKDWIGKGYTSTFYDALNPQARELFWNLLSKNLYSKGVDAWWMDASEPDILSNASVDHRKLLMNPTTLGSSTKYFNIYPFMNAKGIYEGQRKENPDARVFILTRSAFAGIQKYGAATWSGDIAATFDEFERQIPGGLNFALSGLPYWTTDIGGFFVEDKFDRPEPKGEALEEFRELNTRWYQYGAFCPMFRSHGQFPYREIFNIAPETHPAYKSMLYYDKLRYKLMPYIYSLTGNIYHKDYTLMRPLVMDFTSDVKVKNIGDQFMFGPAFLISPVYKYKARSRQLYLPANTGWYDFYTGSYYEGNQALPVNAPLENIPVFVKEGSIVPVGPAIEYTTEKHADPITLYVYAGKDATFELYEDENINYNYEKGAFATIPILYNETARTLTIGGRKGEFPGMLKERTFQLVWVGKNKPVGFSFDSKPTNVIKYNGKEQTIILNP